MTEHAALIAQREFAAAGCCDASGCPDPDTLIAFAEGRLDGTARDAVAARVTGCARCAAAVRVALDATDWAAELAADLGRGEPAALIHSASSVRRPRRHALVPMALAASVALLFAAGLLLRQPPGDEPLRGPSIIATTPVDGAQLRQAPTELTWPCERAPSAATVELLAADATPRWSGNAAACAAILPEEVRGRLAPGAYLWRVKNAAGEVLLGPIGFRIAS